MTDEANVRTAGSLAVDAGIAGFINGDLTSLTSLRQSFRFHVVDACDLKGRNRHVDGMTSKAAVNDDR